MADDPGGEDEKKEPGEGEEIEFVESSTEEEAAGGAGDSDLPAAVPAAVPAAQPKTKSTATTEFADPLTARRNLILIGLGVFLLVKALPGLDLPGYSYINRLRDRTYDLMITVQHQWFRPDPPEQVAVVNVDDESLDRYGRWPWKRKVMADLVRGLDKLEARVIAIDILLSSKEEGVLAGLESLAAEAPDSESGKCLTRIVADVKEHHRAFEETPEEPDDWEDLFDPKGYEARLAEILDPQGGDLALAAAIRESGKVVLGTTYLYPSAISEEYSWFPRSTREDYQAAMDKLDAARAALDEAAAAGADRASLERLEARVADELEASRSFANYSAAPENLEDIVRLRTKYSDEELQELWWERQLPDVLFQETGAYPTVEFGMVGDTDVAPLGNYWRLDNGLTPFKLINFTKSGTTDEVGVGIAVGLQIPRAPFMDAARGLGYMNDEANEEGVVRAMSLYRFINDYPIPSLSLAAIAAYHEGTLEFVYSTDSIDVTNSVARPDAIRVVRGRGARRKAVDGFFANGLGRIFLNFYGLDEFKAAKIKHREDVGEEIGEIQQTNLVPRIATVPAWKILDYQAGRLPKAELRGLQQAVRDRICFVGVGATGLTDIRATPMGRFRPGVEMHATAAANLLNGEELQWREAEEWFGWTMEFVFVMVLALVLPRLSPWQNLFATIAMCAASFFLCVVVAGSGSVLVPWDLIFPLVTLFLVGLAYLNRFENKEKAWIDNMFKRYVSADYVEELKRNKGELSLTGTESEITPFFSDMAKFSTISEAFSAEGLFRFLGEYLGEMADILDEYGGTLDKFEGDAVVAFFGAPIWTPDHASRACLASLRMQERIVELEEDWKTSGRYPELYVLQEKVGYWFPIRVRIGLNSGVCATGHLGTAERGNYTMMGDNVNLAARLEAGGKQFGIILTISEDTYELSKDAIEGREIDVIQVVGRTVPTKIYEVMARKGELGAEREVFLGMYEEGLKYYKDRRFQEALEQFEKASRRAPEDKPTSMYLTRCQDFLVNPPPEDWDGVNVLTEK